jgi:hypothetical protein
LETSPSQHEVGDPEGQAVDEDGVGRGQRLGQPRGEVERRLHGDPGGRALGLVPRDPQRHVGIARLGGGDEGDPTAGRQAGDGEAALAAARPAQDEE